MRPTGFRDSDRNSDSRNWRSCQELGGLVDLFDGVYAKGLFPKIVDERPCGTLDRHFWSAPAERSGSLPAVASGEGGTALFLEAEPTQQPKTHATERSALLRP